MKKILPMLGAILIIFFIFKAHLLTVNTVNIQTKNINCTNINQIDGFLKLKGKYIFLIDEASIINSLKLQFPCIGQIEVIKIFPQSLIINLTGRVPLVFMRSYITKPIDLVNDEASPSSESALLDWSTPDSSDSGLVADQEGYLFADTGKSTLPTLFFSGQVIKIGEKLNTDIFQAVDAILQKIPSLNLNNNLPQFKLVGNDLLVLSQPNIAFSLIKDINIQLASLQLIWQKNTIDGKKMELIDLRFDKPVVVFIPQKRS